MNDQFRICFRWTGRDVELPRSWTITEAGGHEQESQTRIAARDARAVSLIPLCMSNYWLAKEIGAPAQRIGEILAGQRAVTADTDLRLCRFFGLPDGWWLHLQEACWISIRLKVNSAGLVAGDRVSPSHGVGLLTSSLAILTIPSERDSVTRAYQGGKVGELPLTAVRSVPQPPPVHGRLAKALPRSRRLYDTPKGQTGPLKGYSQPQLFSDREALLADSNDQIDDQRPNCRG